MKISERLTLLIEQMKEQDRKHQELTERFLTETKALLDKHEKMLKE